MSDSEHELKQSPRNDATLVALALAGLMCFHFCANVWWLRADHHVVRTDEETHMFSARDYYDVLFEQHHDNPVLKLIAVGDIAPGYPAHPPLLPMLGTLTVRAFGYSPDAIALTDTFLFMIALLGVFLLARTFMPPWHAVFTTFVVSMTPVIFASSRYFMTDFLAMTIAIWAVYALVQSNGFRNTAWVFVFAVLNGLAILARTPGFLHYFIPCCVVVLIGLSKVWQGGEEKGSRLDGRVFRVWLLNCLMTLVVTVGIASPWYFHHLEAFNKYWAQDHEVDRGGPLASAIDVEHLREVEEARRRAAEEREAGNREEVEIPAETEATPETEVTESLPEAPEVPDAGEDVETVSEITPTPKEPLNLPPVLKRFVYPPVPWTRYPTYIVNNGMFLPLFLLAVIGLPVAFIARSFRSRTAFLILLWVLGSWALHSAVLKDSTARYAIPFIPGLSIFAAITVLALPWRGVRILCTSLLAAFLVFQYGNLTLHSYGKFAKAEVPVEVDETGAIARIGGKEAPFVDAWVLDWYHDDGLVIFKDTLTLSDAYGRLAAPTPIEDNFKDRIFRAMAREEQLRETQLALPGDYAGFLQLNLRGMEFDQRHYWADDDNPYKTQDWRPDEFPRRKFISLGLQYAPEPLLTKLDQADYVVYAIPTAEPEEEARWAKLFEDRDFKRIEHFTMPRLGQVPERNYGVLARDLTSGRTAITSAADFDRFNIEQLYQIATSPVYEQMNSELRGALRERFESLLRDRDVWNFAMLPSVLCQWGGAVRKGENEYEFTFLFEVSEPLPISLDFFFRGQAIASYEGPMPEGTLDNKIQHWDFTPVPPTTEWGREDFPYVMVRKQIKAAPTIYRLELGLMEGSTARGDRVRINEFDFQGVQ